VEIAVTTPHGRVGEHVVRHLVRAGVRPRELSRRTSVDLRDEAALTEALAGVEALYLVVPSDETAPDPVAAYDETGAVVARAVAATGVPRVVLQSSLGAEKRHGAGEIDGLARVEEHLDRLVGTHGLDVTHLRCGYFMSNLLIDQGWRESGVLETLVDGPLAWVAPYDIATVATGLLLHRDWHGRRVQAVHGPEDLTFAEAASVLGVRAERIADDTVRARLRDAGLGEAQVEAVVGMSTGLREGFVPEQPRDAVSTTETTLAQWALTALRP
jgi:uncharacterized protein YbjT (DUF2867 family)